MSSSRRRSGRPWTQGEIERFRLLLAHYTAVDEIARTLGRTEFALRKKASRIGISTRVGNKGGAGAAGIPGGPPSEGTP